MTNFFEILLAACGLLKWFLLIIWWPFYPSITYAESLEKLSINIPEAHIEYIKKFVFDKENECLRHGIDFEIEVDPDAINTLKISDGDDTATIFQAVLNCDGLGNLWSATSGVRTFVLVGGQVFEAWLAAPPERIVLEGAIFLLFTLDASQCQTNLETVYGVTHNCFAVLRWLPEKQQFYGYKSPINFVTSLN